MTKGFPRSHLYIVAALSLGLCSIVIANLDSATPIPEPVSMPYVEAVPVPEPEDATLAAALPAPPEPSLPDTAVSKTTRTVEHTIQPGDRLDAIFKSKGVNTRELFKVTNAEPHGKRLHQIYPGHRVQFGFDADGVLQEFTYTPGPLQTLQFSRVGDTFQSTELLREPDTELKFGSSVIEHSLFVASQRAGFSDALTMELAHIFQWDIDFVLDIRQGDSFSVLFQEEYLDGERIGHGDVLAAEFVNQGETYRAVLYEDSQGRRSYYDPSGRNMRKAFLRAPVEFSRISSNFNLRRVHPLFKKRMPHRGIDYAATAGTPILAAGDGRVHKASRTQPNGNYVIINHGEQFQTKYLHLSRFAKGIRAGSKVTQGQVIGYVGATGWATAPHLHYEFLVNGVHQNPRTVRLPDAQPIADSERERFLAHAKPIFAQLEQHQQTPQIAAAR